MKYSIYITSDKTRALTEESEFLEKTIFVEAKDSFEALEIATKEASEEKIDSVFLPLSIVINEIG